MLVRNPQFVPRMNVSALNLLVLSVMHTILAQRCFCKTSCMVVFVVSCAKLLAVSIRLSLSREIVGSYFLKGLSSNLIPSFRVRMRQNTSKTRRECNKKYPTRTSEYLLRIEIERNILQRLKLTRMDTDFSKIIQRRLPDTHSKQCQLVNSDRREIIILAGYFLYSRPVLEVRASKRRD